RIGGLLMESQGLCGDGSYTTQLHFGSAKKFVNGSDVVAGGCEIEKGGDGFERIVDLVRDGTGETSDDGELFTLDESLFGSLLLRDFKRSRGDGLDGAVRRV